MAGVPAAAAAALSPNAGDKLPLREHIIHYQASPSPLSQATPLASPPPESTCSALDADSAATLSWKQLKVVVPARGTAAAETVVLEGITGYAEPFRMLAIMGPPRSGKSTLLRTLSGRLTTEASYKGDIRINGRRQQLTYGNSAFLECSKDVLPDFLTVKEHLCLSSLLRLPSSLPRKERLAVAEHMLLEMGLEQIASSNIKRLTAGERRLLSLAVELLIGPYLIYLDDAIKDLQGACALRLLLKLKGLSRGGCTVIACIDHPSSYVYELLDDVCLLASGKLLYFGDNVSLVECFAASGFPCPSLHNPADHFMYTIAADYERLRTPFSFVQDAEKAQALAKVDNQHIVDFLSTSYLNSEFHALLLSKVDALAKKKGGVLVGRTRPAGLQSQIVVLCQRSLLNMTRSVGFFWMRICLSILVMLSLGTVFLRLGQGASSIQARASCLFVALEAMLFLSIAGVPYFHHETEIHLQERVNCEHGAFKFVLGNLLASLPLLLATALLSLCSMYFLVGLHSGVSSFAYVVVNLYLSLIASEGLTLAISIMLANVYSAMVLVACVQFLFMLVAGYVCQLDLLPKPFWYFPMSYVSFHRHSVRGMFQNEFLGSSFENQPGIYVVRLPGKWWSLVILGGFAILYRFLAIAFIELRRMRMRKSN